MVAFFSPLLAALRRLFRKPASPPAPPLKRLFLVYVARDSKEWDSEPGNYGFGAFYCPPDGRYDPLPALAKFNHDSWPRICSRPGKYSVQDILSEARLQDIAEGRDKHGSPIVDNILHEVAGHHCLGVGADHDSPNTLMNDRNGPKREKDREELRRVLLTAFDGFEVRRGLPPRNPYFHGQG